VQLEAADLYNIQAGGGYTTEDGFYGTAEVSYANLFSLGHRIAVSGVLRSDISRGNIVYSSHWIFGQPLLTDVTAFIERQETVDFTGLFTGGQLSITTQAGLRNWYQTWIRFENTLWLHDTVSGQNISDETRGNVVLFGAGYTRDQRKNLMNAGIGYTGVVEGEIAGPWISWSDTFYRLTIDIRGYSSFFKSKIICASALFAGYVKQYGSGKNVPPQELFRVGEGGVRALRGYDDESIIKQPGIAGGGKIALILNPVEATFPIYRMLIGSLFLDCGAIWQTPDHIRMSDLRWSAGPGLRLVDLPIGTVRLDYGIPLNKESDIAGRIHFGIGASF
jgi:outer membrane protein insertion porin family